MKIKILKSECEKINNNFTSNYIEAKKKKGKKKKQAPKGVCWEGYEMVGMKEKDGRQVPNCVPKKACNCSENCNCKTNSTAHKPETNTHEENSVLRMYKANLKNIINNCHKLMEISLDSNMEGWIADKISTSKDDILDVKNYLLFSDTHNDTHNEDYMDIGECEGDTEAVWFGDECYDINEEEINDDCLPCNQNKKHETIVIAKKKNKKGKNVKLNKPFRTPNGPKKFSVYVKNDKGNVVKVNFGDPKMEIKRDDPERRKNFRSRHKCDNPGPKWKPRYWSCKMWSSKKVSDIT